MKRMMRTVLLLGLGLSFLAGCRGSPPRGGRYDTVGEDVRRDTEKARRENSRAVELIKDGEIEKAEEILKDALSCDLMFGPAHNNLGKAYYHQKKLYLSAWEFQYAVKLMPSQPEPRNNLGLVFEAVGRFDKAVEEYGKALALEPDNPEILGNLARARIRRGDEGEEVRRLLSDLVMKDSRPEWVEWAKERLVRMGNSTE